MHRDIAIVGAGFAGLCIAIRLKRAGIHAFTIYERSDTIGGTWRENTYPGAGCDVQSHVYSFSFEPYPDWSSMFGKQPEIQAYLEHCTDKYDIRSHIRFGVSVETAMFDADTGMWTLSLGTGETRRVHVLVSAAGALNRPRLPDIAGRSTFRGRAFHSAAWDHGCSLDDQRVAVIGTGASAIQLIPQIAKRARSVHVFQRTAAWVLPKRDRSIGAGEKRLYRAIPAVQQLFRRALYLSLEARAALFVSYPGLMKYVQLLAARYINAAVSDPVLRDKLMPDYRLGCKRILLANDYYPTLQQPHVEVITTPIARIADAGVVTVDDPERIREVDVIVYCTGFEAAEDVAPFPIRGLDGRWLHDVWRSAAQAYLGCTVAGFPNLYFMLGPNTGLGHNSMVFMAESHANYVLSCIQRLANQRLTYMDVRREVQDRYNQYLQTRLSRTVWSTGCTSWYHTADGFNTTLWPGYTLGFRVRTLRMRPRDYRSVK